MLLIDNITCKSFEPFGKVIRFSDQPADPRFEVVVEEANQPWRIAMLRVIERSFDRMECHVCSMESFEPVSGCGILIVAQHEHPEQYQAFLLDQPVCLSKGIWHQVITLSPQTLIKITENLSVSSEFFMLNKQLSATLSICPFTMD